MNSKKNDCNFSIRKDDVTSCIEALNIPRSTFSSSNEDTFTLNDIVDGLSVKNCIRFLNKLKGYENEKRKLAAYIGNHFAYIYESVVPNDPRPRLAAKAALLYADGLLSKLELRLFYEEAATAANELKAIMKGDKKKMAANYAARACRSAACPEQSEDHTGAGDIAFEWAADHSSSAYCMYYHDLKPEAARKKYEELVVQIFYSNKDYLTLKENEEGNLNDILFKREGFFFNKSLYESNPIVKEAFDELVKAKNVISWRTEEAKLDEEWLNEHPGKRDQYWQNFDFANYQIDAHHADVNYWDAMETYRIALVSSLEPSRTKINEHTGRTELNPEGIQWFLVLSVSSQNYRNNYIVSLIPISDLFGSIISIEDAYVHKLSVKSLPPYKRHDVIALDMGLYRKVNVKKGHTYQMHDVKGELVTKTLHNDSVWLQRTQYSTSEEMDAIFK